MSHCHGLPHGNCFSFGSSSIDLHAKISANVAAISSGEAAVEHPPLCLAVTAVKGQRFRFGKSTPLRTPRLMKCDGVGRACCCWSCCFESMRCRRSRVNALEEEDTCVLSVSVAGESSRYNIIVLICRGSNNVVVLSCSDRLRHHGQLALNRKPQAFVIVSCKREQCLNIEEKKEK